MDPSTLATLITLAAVAVAIFVLRTRYVSPRVHRRAVRPETPGHGFGRKKPVWVKREVIRLKSLMPHEGCRTIALAFNSLFTKKGETVGKTYVAEIIKRHAVEIRLLRKKLKNRKRRPGPPNHTWAMDGCFLAPDKPPVLGILDHGTRTILCLRELRIRSTIGVLRLVLDTIETFGRPRVLRSDNEAIFTSRPMSLALLVLGVRHQRIDPFCPWQNGRIERLFKSLKERVGAWWKLAGIPDDVRSDLDTFRTWYNQARPHQSLLGLTPVMAWAGVTTTTKPPRFFEAWDGILTGWVPRL